MSILDTICEMLGPSSTYGAFQTDLIVLINTVFNFLRQIGCGPADGFEITGPTETWDQFVDDKNLNMVKTFVYIKVKLAFDPPASSATIEVLNKLADEIEFRIRAECDEWGVNNG